jgi:hypothetical protein
MGIFAPALTLEELVYGKSAPVCGFRSMWAGDSSGCRHRKQWDVGIDYAAMWAGKSD